jgi:hypothetical protein
VRLLCRLLGCDMRYSSHSFGYVPHHPSVRVWAQFTTKKCSRCGAARTETEKIS